MRAYVTSRGHTGVSFGIFGFVFIALAWLVLGFLWICGAIVFLLAELIAHLWRNHKANQLPESPGGLPIPAPSPPPAPIEWIAVTNVGEGDPLTLTDSRGVIRTGIAVNKHRGSDGGDLYDLLEDPGSH